MKISRILFSVIIFGTTACGSAKKETATQTAAEEAPADSLSLFTVGVDHVKNKLSLSGKVSYNQDKITKVFSLVSGHMQDVKSVLGDYVKAGQVLAIIQSGDLADLQQNAVSAKSQLSVAQKNLQVTKDMSDAGLASQKDLVAAQEMVESAKGEVRRVAARQNILGSSASTYYIKAPVSGFIVEKNAQPGMELRSDDPESLFTISNLDPIWILANVYENDVSKIKLGQEAKITTLSYPDKVYTGRIDKIFNMLDPESKTMKVRVTLSNADFLLKPEMFAKVNLEYGFSENKLIVPSESIIFDNNKNYVVIGTNFKDLKIVPVDVFQKVDDITFLNGGVNSGDKIVKENAYLLYNSLTKN
ncbi:efflux RND transporter periplasmic adaptor subunit [Lacihabitans lacunae]|jgi:membrane fusion protein, heavy metal efflux system|uniref:Efflux RND transporter periplasmic adaptor subunit n=1 Tax=Lacihabitans lacunae TaxID=1028214 RepID=A0ABV7YX88_9BACT